MDDHVSLRLNRDLALVLFDWLARTSAAGAPVAFEDQAEQRALWDLESALESRLPEVVGADYAARVTAARDQMRDGDA